MTTATEALILLTPAAAQPPAAVEATLTAADGHIVASFLPHALMIQATDAALGELRQSLGAATVYTEAVPAPVLADATEPLRSVLTAWNARRSQAGAPPEPLGRGLAWDAPGFLPPDPPPEVREMLRRCEQQHDAVADSPSS